ncbi:hypothetical protein [Herbaspirillum sp. AP21]|uniref:hypothetical protein n=1 Tax=Herbaspirillum sp. AP21 TaxID=2754073 RepID=UPI0015DA7FEC|nr:hypothetical protein [Herbaspirillum sp. AP21]NZD69640.1 hypothetical protein [Herbaspirillum sp. AP21]
MTASNSAAPGFFPAARRQDDKFGDYRPSRWQNPAKIETASQSCSYDLNDVQQKAAVEEISLFFPHAGSKKTEI